MQGRLRDLAPLGRTSYWARHDLEPKRPQGLRTVNNPELKWAYLPGKTLSKLSGEAVEKSFLRHRGKRSAVRAELGISKSGLLRWLDRLKLRESGTENPQE